MTSTTSVSVNFKRHEMVILGTEYAGEMKKGVRALCSCDGGGGGVRCY